ncbi:SDR family NAD(P)-dependent oxidoreductase [Neorhizobium sp. T25_13]|uniref:SDR family NAD(P)-dependent oxidoreductase n=1 Tax=Neorhizobium sp. T25_13 TaxID=2093830 RepID=UPI000CF97108|nr:SDR family oxidoreductase [Neorhizobium sp. T25_13]
MNAIDIAHLATTDLTGQRAVVIGAGYGVGPAVVSALAEAGATVLTDDANAPAGEHIASVGLPADLIESCIEKLGGLDILVVSSRPVKNKPVLDMTPEEMRSVAEEEMVSPALQMQEAARHMVKAGYGRIIVFASMSAKTGVHHDVAPYAAAKGGLLAFARVLAAETAEHGVTVNGIATALFEPQVKTMTEEKRTRLKGAIPVGRFGRSEEAAHAVLFLAARNAGFVTGECLNLSGGRFMD